MATTYFRYIFQSIMCEGTFKKYISYLTTINLFLAIKLSDIVYILNLNMSTNLSLAY